MNKIDKKLLLVTNIYTFLKPLFNYYYQYNI